MSLNYEMKSNLNDNAVDEFLNSQTKEGTFKSYKTVMKQYLEHTQKTEYEKQPESDNFGANAWHEANPDLTQYQNINSKPF